MFDRKLSPALAAALVALLCTASPGFAVTAGDMKIDFSVDAGGDRELSDIAPSGDECFDPGDVYEARGDVYPPLGGSDGAIDDASLLGTDVAPDTPDPSAATGIPFYACSSADPPSCFRDFHDLDGFDAINIDLASLIDPDSPLENRLDRNSFTVDERRCIVAPAYLGISFDDDAANGWLTGPGAPVDTSSPGGSRFGTSTGNNEIFAVTLTPASGGPALFTVSSMVGAASETDLHEDLSPDPDDAENEDDDVDALDVRSPAADCSIRLFSMDHEANDGRARGIYQDGGGTPTLVIRPNVHLGLPALTDIDAFEFVWLSSGESYALALIYSVDDDDPDTPAWESGPRHPGTVLGSFLDGSSFPVVRLSIDEDIDAIAASGVDLSGWDQGDNP